MSKYELEKNHTILGDVQVSAEIFDWFGLLTQGNADKVAEFAVLNDECSTTPMAIIKYRGMLLEKQARDLQIDEEGTNEEIAEQLQEIFLEPVNTSYVKQIKKTMAHTGWTWDALVKAHYDDIEKRIWRFVGSRNTKYIA